MNAYQVILIVEMEFALNAIILVYNAQAHQLANAHLVRISFTLKEYLLTHNAFVQINILMILKISFANHAHQLALLVQAIKTHAPNV